MKTAIFICLLCVQAAFAAPAKPKSVLPQTFGGWQLAKAPQTSTNPESADPINAQLLKEYGFTAFEGATYTRDDGRKLTIKAARFKDASGAYGAFLFYKLPQMLDETIGDQAASLNERILFFKGNTLIDAVFQHLSQCRPPNSANWRAISLACPGQAQACPQFLTICRKKVR